LALVSVLLVSTCSKPRVVDAESEMDQEARAAVEAATNSSLDEPDIDEQVLSAVNGIEASLADLKEASEQPKKMRCKETNYYFRGDFPMEFECESTAGP